ncbi:MAG: CDP-alcohol phosphatidyltransferase family protein [Candidatus Omnitrophota bacterium]
MLTDAIDGFLARFLKQKTPLGTIMDPIADKFLLVTSFIALTVWNGSV